MTEPFTMRSPCTTCGGTAGTLKLTNGQNCCFCSECQTFQYNAPKTETGQQQRTISTTHKAISPKVRFRILERASGRCEVCGATNNLHVGHILSVADGYGLGVSDSLLNSDENLICLCEECNLGEGRLSFSPRFYVALLTRRAYGPK